MKFISKVLNDRLLHGLSATSQLCL